MDETGQKRGCSLWMGAFVVLAVGLMIFLGLSQLGASRMGQTRRGWEQVVGTRSALLERFPVTPTNEAARRLEAAARVLGIDVTRRDDSGGERATGEAVDEFKAIRRELGQFVDEQIQQPHRGRLTAPAQTVATFLDSHRADIDTVRRLLLEDETPLWKEDLGQGHAAPIPNLLGLLDLQKLLVAEALSAARRNDERHALETLEASWRLNRGLRRRADLISQIVSLSIATWQAGTLRHVGGAAATWLQRLNPEDFRASFLESLQIEGWVLASFTDRVEVDPDNIFGSMGLLARPYVQMCLADSSDDYRKRLETVMRLRVLCDEDLSAQGADLTVSPPAWNKLGHLMPDFNGSLARLARLEFDLELTRKVIGLDLLRRSRGGTRPEPTEGLETSDVCPRDHWNYEIVNDGGYELSFSRPIAWPGVRGASLPTHFVTGP